MRISGASLRRADEDICPYEHPGVFGDMLGKNLSHYRIVEQIGAGGMGVVFLAHDEQLERDVAIKVLPPGTLADEAARKRFRQEALSLAKLKHPNIATIHDFDTDGQTDFLAARRPLSEVTRPWQVLP